MRFDLLNNISVAPLQEITRLVETRFTAGCVDLAGSLSNLIVGNYQSDYAGYDQYIEIQLWHSDTAVSGDFTLCTSDHYKLANGSSTLNNRDASNFTFCFKYTGHKRYIRLKWIDHDLLSVTPLDSADNISGCPVICNVLLFKQNTVTNYNDDTIWLG